MLTVIIPLLIGILFVITYLILYLAIYTAPLPVIKVISAIFDLLFYLVILSALFLVWLNCSDSGRLLEAKDKIRAEQRHERRRENLQKQENENRTYLIRAADELGIPEKDRDALIKKIEDSPCR